MPLCSTSEVGLLGLQFGDTAYTPPATFWVGLVSASTWLATTAYTVGNLVVPTTFNSLSGSVGRIFKCTTAGTSGSTQPTWPTTAGGTVTDGSVTWTEVSNLFAAGTFSGEPSTGAYGRVSVTNNTTNFPAPTGDNPASGSNGTAITFPTTTASWGAIAAFFLNTASSAGTYHAWGCLSSLATGPQSTGVTPSFASGALTYSLV